MEGALSESEEKYRTQFEEALDAILVADAETGVIIDCNHAASQLVGREKSELVGKHQRILHPPEGVEGEFSRTYKQHLKEKEGQVLEDRVITKNGEIKDVAIKANVFELRGRKLIQGIFREITERKRMEEKLHDERDLLCALMDNIPDTIYFKDANSRFTRINRAQAEALGIKEPEDAVGKADFDFFTADHSRAAYADEQEVIRSGKPLIDKIERVGRPDGYFFWVSATKVPIKNKGGRVIGLVGISRDITERKKLEDELAHERDLFRALMDNVPDPIYFKDTESRFMRVSKVSCPGLGVRSPEEAVGMTDFDFCPEELAEQFRADDLMVMESGEPLINKEEVMIDQIGKKWYSATKVPIRGKDGQVIGLVGISRDITKLKETEEELRRYSEHLEELVKERTRKLREAERMAAIGETAAMVGHDLRNPLQGIVGLIYLLEKQVEDMPSEIVGKQKIAERLKSMEEQVAYMDKIVSDLRDYARPVNAGPVPTCVSRLVNEVLPLVAIPPNVQVSVSMPEDLPRLMLDPELMKRVFSNLIMNAVQAMPDGGRLTVKAFRESDGAFISIQDTGIGIPEENLSKIFKPLFTTKSKGQGFGLAVCKRIVEAHEGTIDVESELGRGSIFTIKIPLKEEVSLVA